MRNLLFAQLKPEAVQAITFAIPELAQEPDDEQNDEEQPTEAELIAAAMLRWRAQGPGLRPLVWGLTSCRPT